MHQTTISDPLQLRDHYGEASDMVQRKALPRLDKHCRAFIEAAPFLVIATADGGGRADASPRGDAPGFVAIADEQTLLIPDRPGNRRVDTLSNILANPHVGLIFFVPGMNETLRVNGKAEITTDAAMLEPLSVRGKLPVSAIVVHIEEAFLHCAKALIRSDLWNPQKHIERSSFPTLGRMIADQIQGVDATAADQLIQESIEKRLY
jgi:PPOX class probable FMN-dependent enzyme